MMSMAGITSSSLKTRILPPDVVPGHIAVIMDGNRRFGRARFSDPLKGHWEGGKVSGDDDEEEEEKDEVDAYRAGGKLNADVLLRMTLDKVCCIGDCDFPDPIRLYSMVHR